MSGWEVVERDGESHVLPLGDLRDHAASRLCWCCPDEDPHEAHIIVHNSMDRREDFEKGRAPS